MAGLNSARCGLSQAGRTPSIRCTCTHALCPLTRAQLAASPLPQRLIPDFGKARTRLLDALAAADKRGLFNGTAAGDLLGQ